MLTDADFALRRTGITSTDITRLVGESPWGTKCDVYLEKISEAPPTPPTLYQRIGHLLEPLVLELLSEQFHVTLARSATVQHPTLAWALATPDGVGNDCTAEAKVKSVSFARPRELTLQFGNSLVRGCCPRGSRGERLPTRVQYPPSGCFSSSSLFRPIKAHSRRFKYIRSFGFARYVEAAE